MVFYGFLFLFFLEGGRGGGGRFRNSCYEEGGIKGLGLKV